ncbi:MAG: potassium transporter TrkA [Halobacteriales archaeon]
MASLLVELFLGIYVGLLTGIVPALVAGGLGFLFKYVTDVTLPGLGVVVLAVAIAGVNGGLLGLIDPTISQSPRLLTALVVVMMLSLYAHDQGDRLGQTLPRRFSLRALGTRTLSGEAIFDVGGIGRVRVDPLGEVEDLEGYPPMSGELRQAIATDSWVFAADLPIEAIERQLEDRLRARYDLAEVEVRIDEQGRARIAAAPPLGSLSRRVPDGQRAVSVSGLVPTGLARRDRVELRTPDRTVTGTVLSARSDLESVSVADGGTETDHRTEAPTAPTTTGGEGRVTVAVDPETARFLLGVDRARLVVLPRGLGLEFAAVRRLREAGHRFASLTVSVGAAGRTLAEVTDTTGVRVLARQAGPGVDVAGVREWQVDPPASTVLGVGDELVAVGQPGAIDRLRGELA